LVGGLFCRLAFHIIYLGHFPHAILMATREKSFDLILGLTRKYGKNPFDLGGGCNLVVECSCLLFSLHLEGPRVLYTNSSTSLFVFPSVSLGCGASRPGQDGNVAPLRAFGWGRGWDGTAWDRRNAYGTDMGWDREVYGWIWRMHNCRFNLSLMCT
jgi:hypothetical protein